MPAGSSGSSLARAGYRVGRILGRVLDFVDRVPPWLVLGALVVLGWVIAAESGRIAPHDGPLYYHGGTEPGTTRPAGCSATAHSAHGDRLRLSASDRPDRPNRGREPPRRPPLDRRVQPARLAPIAFLCVYGIARMFASRGFAYPRRSPGSSHRSR